MFARFMEGRDPTEFTLKEKASFVAQGILSGKIFDLAKRGNVSMWKELSGYFSQPEVKAMLAETTENVEAPERRTFLIANRVCEQLAFRFFEKFVKQLSGGNVIESIQALSGMVPILVVLAPYIYGFSSQAPSRRWLRETCLQLTGEVPPMLQNRKRAWFTDTLEDVNGVSTTIRKMAAAAKAAGEELVVVTSLGEVHVDGIAFKNFRPIGEFELPEYELQKLSFPPILRVLDYVQQEQFTEIIISTPGPMGLVGLLAGKMLNVRTSGIYHTDFPEYIRILTEDKFLESLAWTYMRWFYGQQDTVFVNSQQYRQSWIDRGIEEAKLQILPRGLDTELFTPGRRHPEFWHRFAGNVSDGDAVRLLYVGRVSKEKDLDILAAAYRQLRDAGVPVQLYIVGVGPYAEALATALPDAVFTGYLAGEELATAYASADIFVFPSTTDTFGNVIIEAQAAGLPVIVSHVGGPQEVVEHGVTGLVTKALDVEAFAEAVRTLAADADLRVRMGTAARASVADRSWPWAFQRFWAATADDPAHES
jgi:glycosyltransferase involved in cell wall biosynthesis